MQGGLRAIVKRCFVPRDINGNNAMDPLSRRSWREEEGLSAGAGATFYGRALLISL